ncbi:MAG: bifunctional demethylmenaquinone methyltransferase/2-methoxy-6-polyprenyl-1,4-benzoquinol methylase UbiE [Bacillota bacterium]|nr:bifunctional demethylmenaquinone methyltransferase/2-methoxy-6-polyprenyl-1,4-benzoquinol methylase UbiE [Bacillota bacterium]
MQSSKEEKVYNVFQTISEGYDDANTRISFGMEKKWKQNLINLFAPNSKVLDVCCGTGDISIALKNKNCEVTGLDFSPAMLDVAKRKCSEGITWLEGNAMQLPFEDNSFDAACISFGLRNTPDYEAVLKEMKRVVKTGGIIACLDSFVPDNGFVKFFYNIYFKGIMPHIGGHKEHKEEYDWLANSTENFLRADELKKLFEQIDIKNVKVKKMMCGACCLHKGIK